MYAKKAQGWRKHIDFILLDMVVLQVAFILAYITRHGIACPYASPIYRNLAIVFALADLLVLVVNGSMKNVLKRGYFKELEQTIRHVFFVMVLVSLYMFSAQSGDDYSRITFFLTVGYHVVLGYLTRLVWKRLLLYRKWENHAPAMYYITIRNRAEYVIRRFQESNIDHTLIRGLCLLDEDGIGQEIDGVPITANFGTVLDYLCDKWVDEIFVSLPESFPYPSRLITTLVEMGMVVHVEMEQPGIENWQHQVIEKIAGTTVRTISITMATPMQKFMKRALDIVGGLFGCILTGLLTLIIGPMIYIKSPGPIFFTQTRVGKNGRKFKLYKFRSMYLDAEERKAELMAHNRIGGGLMFKLEYDPRIIGCEKRADGTIKKGIGNFIRDYSLDEFPQFFNVLKGDLSLCGTRPPTVDEWEKYELHHRARMAIKPGITGLWQISGRSNITDFEQVVALDKKYIQEWSMGLDFRILLRTIKVVFSKEGSM